MLSTEDKGVDEIVGVLSTESEDKGVDEILVCCLLKIRVWMKYWCAVY